MTELIGRGERPTLAILKLLYSEWRFFTQIKIRDLYGFRASRDYPKPSEEHLRSSVDILMVKPLGSGEVSMPKSLCVAFRVQGDSHTGTIKSKRDGVQRGFLEDWHIKVIDICEWNCKELFKDKINPKSVKEVIQEIEAWTAIL